MGAFKRLYKWTTIVNPITFQPMVALPGTRIELSVEQLKEHRMNENELMMRLLDSPSLSGEDAVDAYMAFKQFLVEFPNLTRST